MRRQFHAQAADQVWLTDITEHWADEGKLYLCAIKDVYSNSDRGLLDRLTDGVLLGGDRSEARGGITLTGRHDRPLR